MTFKKNVVTSCSFDQSIAMAEAETKLESQQEEFLMTYLSIV